MDSPEYGDALIGGRPRGRGAGVNPGNRFEAVRLHVLGEYLDHRSAVEGDAPQRVATQTFADDSKTIINPVDSPDVGFRWSINPYRGCEHGCSYCYARPFHEALGFSSGLDFETKIMVKRGAAAMLRKELGRAKWRGETIAMSGVTDCYQPIEARYRITRGCLEVMADCRQAVGIVTKNKLVLRDLDLLTRLAEHGAVAVAISVTTLQNDLAAKMEPRASSPGDRLAAVRALAERGIPVAVMMAPVIPGLNDREVPAILEAAAEAGARRASYVFLRLPYQVKQVFSDWLAQAFPDRAQKVLSLIRQARGGRLNDATVGRRMRGEGSFARQVGRVFEVFAKKHGLDRGMPALNHAAFRRPGESTQGVLF